MSSVREYAILYVGGKRLGAPGTAGGGNVILNAGQHALIGPEHTGWPSSANLALDGSSVNVDTGSGYKAFPGLCLMPNGNLLLVYGHGTDHTSDGVIKQRVSTDGGLTWGAASTIYTPAAGYSAGPGGVTTLSDGRIMLTVQVYNDTTNVWGTLVLISDDNAATWGSPITVTSSFTYTAISEPVVEVSPDRLLIPVYSAPVDSAALLVSTDGGATWGGEVTIATGGGHDWTEPWIVRLASGDLLCLLRVNDIGEIWTSYSTDDGATWSTPTTAFAGKSRPATRQLASGALLCIYRKPVTFEALYRTSWDNGLTWQAAVALTPSGDAMEYADIAQFASGRVVAVWSYENSTTDADLVLQAFTDYELGLTVQDLAVRGRVGFHDATPIEQPTITGEWADGTAGASLADALNDLGLVHDKTVVGTPASLTYATPTITLGDTAAEGAADSVIRSDAVIEAFDDGTDPTTTAFGDAADPGVADFAARRDHGHGMPPTPADLLTVDPGTVTYDHSGADVVVSVAAVWGYDADGPYYDSAGVTAGEEAILALDPTTGELAAVPYVPA